MLKGGGENEKVRVLEEEKVSFNAAEFDEESAAEAINKLADNDLQNLIESDVHY